MKWLFRSLWVILLMATWSFQASAQSTATATNNTTGNINATTTCAAPLVRTFNVTSNFVIGDVDLGVYATHTRRGDIRITLESPVGTRVQLVNGNVTSITGDNFNVRLSDEATQVVNTDSATANHSTTAPPPFANTFRPNNALTAFDGQNSAGTWRLEVCDTVPASSNGSFRYAELYLTGQFADLSLAKSVATSSPATGATTSYTLQVSSSANSNATASGVEVTDLLPAGATYVNHTGTGTYSSGTGLWQVGSLAPGGSASLTITFTVNATAGASITNVAEITASSLTDSDSTPNNSATGEDDYASATFTVSGARIAGTAPSLPCIAGTSIFDWDTRSWTPGSTSNSYAFGSMGQISFQLVNPGSWQNLAAAGGQSPTLQNSATGGYIPAQLSLMELVDLPNRSAVVTTTINLPRAVPAAQFRLFDVDFGTNQFADKIEVVGYLNGVVVIPVLTNGVANYVIGNVAIGDGTSDVDSANGNVVVTFMQPVDQIVIQYGNHSTAPNNPGLQGVSIHDITVCNPHTVLSVTKVSTVISDPVSGTSDPRAIPGALIEYQIAVANLGPSDADTDSVTISDDGPEGAKICFNTGGSGQPVIFTDGSPNSGLSLGYVAANDPGDSLEFSSDNGSSWNYVPVLDADGCDANITDFRLTPPGDFNAGSSFTLRTSYRIE
ncbi:MAG: DUF11 domain-containing protein [Erythrobacter sp.]|nr:DUF11 domain-containing protein [Erythrobacter sp.]